MKVLVSACLLGRSCKYDGGSNRDSHVLELLKGHEVFPVCPEVMGGRPVPRPPVEICGGRALEKDGTSRDMEFQKGAELALGVAIQNDVELCILQSRSPSCGVRQVYDGTFTSRKINGHGIFAGMLMDNGFKVIDREELTECNNIELL